MNRLILLLFVFLLAACKGRQENAAVTDDSVYTCSMHPQIMQHKPGTCPICNMALIQTSTSKSLGKGEIQLTGEQIELGNIKTDTIRNGMSGNSVTFIATLNFDQGKITAISSRVMGRIEKLHFKNIGDYVRKGDKLYDLYSEDLNNAKNEYLMAIRKKATLDNSLIDFDQLIRSAKNKLLLWGMSENQVQKLATSMDAGSTTSFYATADGTITSLDAKEGDYVMDGGAIVHLADVSTLWAETQLYATDLQKINKDAVAIVQVPGVARPTSGSIEFVNSELSPDTRIALMRVSIPNHNNELKPGMAAYVTIRNPQHNMLSLPIDAVLRDGNGASVWLKTGPNTFKSEMVDVGMETGDRIEITNGLVEGDIVVISGAYLLNSEYIFKKGASPMEGMKM